MESVEDLNIYELIGRGGFATVYRGVIKATGREVAVKMIDKKQMNASGMAKRVREEVAIHSRLKHPAILELITFFEDDNFVYLILELCERGELASFLKLNNTAFSEVEARSILEQVVSGLIYLHGHGIMHRDLTLANLMLTRDFKVKIGDFGLATQVRSAQERHMTMCGTPNFISPEVATRSAHGLEADIWGLGCLLYTLLVGTPPFDTSGVKSTLTKVVMSDYTLPETMSPEAKDLIDCMLRKNPQERIKLQDILHHPWLRGISSIAQQDSGMFTMTTGFSGKTSVVSSAHNHPETKPVLLRPVAEYSTKRNNQMLGHVRSEPLLACRPSPRDLLQDPGGGHPGVLGQGHQMRDIDEYASSPPVRMKSDPKDLPAPLLNDKYTVGMENEAGGQFYNPVLTRSNSIPRMQQTGNQFYRTNQQYSNMSDPREIRTTENPGGMVNRSRGSFHELQSSGYHRQNVQTSSDSRGIQNNFSRQQSLPPNANDRSQQAVIQRDRLTPQSEPNSLRRIEDTVSPLSTLRLRPIRQKTKNAVANILSSGEVCLEFISKKRGKEKIQDVMRISGDGQRVVVYHLGKEGAPITETPTPIPSGGADAFYSYATLPEKLWKKYIYAARFVNLVKAKTPKITLYDSKAKSYLMENEPDPDFETYFYNGVKISYSDKLVKLIDNKGTNNTFNYPLEKSMIPPAFTFYLEHFQSCISHCQRLEDLLSHDPGDVGSSLPMFPVIIGRKPAKEEKTTSIEDATNSSLEKENKAPVINNLKSFQGTIMSEAIGGTSQQIGSMSYQPPVAYDALLARFGTARGQANGGEHVGGPGSQSRSVRSDLSRTMQIPGIGVARLHKDGALQVDYEDGSAISLRAGTTNLDYFAPASGQQPGSTGGWSTYTHHNLPHNVKHKLTQIPQILQRLSKPS